MLDRFVADRPCQPETIGPSCQTEQRNTRSRDINSLSHAVKGKPTCIILAKRILFRVETLCVIAAILEMPRLAQSFQQNPSTPPNAKFAPPPSYVSPTLVPSNVREFLLALGDRIQKPGKERLVLVGSYTDSKISAKPAKLIWEAPGRLLFDRTGAGAPSLVVDDKTGVSNASALSNSDLGVLESLLDDSPEAFLYGFTRGHAHRFLGGRFRTDNGKTPNYSGPWYDIYESVAPVQSLSGAPLRQKIFVFDGINKLLVRTSYLVLQGGTKIGVSTEFGKWVVNGGQATPGQIVRKENGVAVFTFDVSAASVVATVNDGTFPGH